MDDETFHAMIEEEALILDRFGMTERAARLRACTTLREAAEVHQDMEALLRVVKMAGEPRRSVYPRCRVCGGEVKDSNCYSTSFPQTYTHVECA